MKKSKMVTTLGLSLVMLCGTEGTSGASVPLRRRRVHPVPIAAPAPPQAPMRAYPEGCGDYKTDSLSDIQRCWSQLISECDVWRGREVAMFKIVHRESRSWRYADSRSSSSYGLLQQLGQRSSNPVVQFRDACSLSHASVRAHHDALRPWAPIPK